MGWNNPPVSWSELERKLSDRRRPGGRTAWRRRRRARPGRASDCRTRRPSHRGRPTTTSSPYAELHCHSNFSFLDGASHPEELVEEAVRLGLNALAMTDHDGLYGVVRMAEAAETYALPTVDRGRAVARAHRPAERRRRSRGRAPPRAGRARGGLPPAGQDDHGRAAARGGEGQAEPIDLDEVAADGGGAFVVLTGCRKGAGAAGAEQRRQARRPRAELRPAGRRCSGEIGCWSSCSTTAIRSTPSTTTRWPSWPHEAGLPRRRHQQRALRRTRATPARRGAVGGPRPAQPRRHGRLAACVAARPPALRGARWPRRSPAIPGAVARTVQIADALAFPLRAAKPPLPRQDVPDGHTPMSWLRELVRRGVDRALRRPRRPPRGRRPGRARAGGHRGQGLPGLLPDRARDRLVRARPRHPLPGPRVGGQLGGLLRARHHRGRSGEVRAPVRALPLHDPQRGAGHRRRLRLPAGARRSSSTSTPSTAGATPPRSPT